MFGLRSLHGDIAGFIYLDSSSGKIYAHILHVNFLRLQRKSTSLVQPMYAHVCQVRKMLISVVYFCPTFRTLEFNISDVLCAWITSFLGVCFWRFGGEPIICMTVAAFVSVKIMNNILAQRFGGFMFWFWGFFWATMADHVDTHTHNLLYSFVGGSTKTPGKTPHVGRVGRVGGSWMLSPMEINGFLGWNSDWDCTLSCPRSPFYLETEILSSTVDGQNPASPRMMIIPWFLGF